MMATAISRIVALTRRDRARTTSRRRNSALSVENTAGSVAACMCVVDLGQPGDLLRCRPLRRAVRPVAVDAAEQLVVIARRVLVQPDHERATVRLDHHPALAVQGDDRLPHRDAANPQVSGDVVLRDAVTDPQLALKDLPADVVGHLLGARRAQQRPGRRVSTVEGRQRGKSAGDGGLLEVGT